MFDQSVPRGVAFWSFLLSIDRELAEKTRSEGCACGGRLHRANYPRKPRGCLDKLPEEYSVRFSFCCDDDCCRKRHTPPSVRFLGRKVYLGAVVVLLAAMEQGATPRRVRALSNLVGVDKTTLARWRHFWQEHFPRTVFWKRARARLVPVFEIVSHPLSILKAFLSRLDDWVGWKKLLIFLSPISIAEGLVIKISDDSGKPAEDA